MGGPDEIRTPPPPPPPRLTGADAVPPLTPRDPAATGLGAPRADHYEWRTLGTSYLHGGDFLGSMSAMFTDSDRIRSVESDIADLVIRTRTVSGPALGDAMTRLTRLRQVLDSLHTLDGVSTIHRADIDALRSTAVDRLLAGAANPPNEANYQEGLRMLRSLQHYQALEARRDQFVAQAESLYTQPHDDTILYRLDYSGPEFAHLDPWQYPTVAALNNQRVVQTYRIFANSSDPNDQRVAGAVRDLFGHLRARDGVFANNTTGTATLETLEAATRDLEGVFSNADLQTFFQRLGTADRSAMLENDGSRVRLTATESLTMLQTFPALLPILDQYDVRIGAMRSPADQRTLLLETVRALIRRGDPYMPFLMSQPPGAEADAMLATVRADLVELQSLETSLNGMSGDSLTRPGLSAVASRMAVIARDFQPVEEKLLRDSLTRLIAQTSQLPSPENNIQPIRDALAAITDTSPAAPTDRAAAYRRVAQMIDAAAQVRLIDARISVIQQQLSQVGTHHTIVQIGLGMDDSPNSGEFYQEYRGAAAESEGNYTRLLGEYRRIRGLVTSSDPAEVARGRRDLQQMEGVAIQGTLTSEAENAQLFNQITIGAGIILVAALTAEFGGLALAGVAESFFAGTTLALGTQEILVGVVYYTSMTAIFTGVSRPLNEAAFGPNANQHGFFTDLLINGLMFGVVGGAMRGVGRVIEGTVERLAIQNLAREGSLVLAGEGAAGVGRMSRFAMETTQRALVEREMARIMEGFTARLGRGATMLGTEYTMFNLFAFVQTAAELRSRNVPNYMERATQEVLSARGQARIASFIVAMRVLNAAAEPFVAPVRQRLSDRLGEQFLRAREAEWRRDSASIINDMVEGRITDPAEALRRTQELVERRQRILMEQNARETRPSEDISREFASGELLLRQLDARREMVSGLERIQGDRNPYGVRPFSEDGSVCTYRAGQAQRIVDAFRALPGGVDRANIRVHPNGMIEVPLLETPLVEPLGLRMEARTVYFMPEGAVPRRPTGSAIVPRPTTAMP